MCVVCVSFADSVKKGVTRKKLLRRILFWPENRHARQKSHPTSFILSHMSSFVTGVKRFAVHTIYLAWKNVIVMVRSWPSTLGQVLVPVVSVVGWRVRAR